MKTIHVALIFAGAALASQAARSHSLELGPEARADEGKRQSQSMDAVTNKSTCDKGDEVVFSCPLGDGSKSASMCAAQGGGADKGRFYYAYGKPGTTELLYPTPGGSGGEAFTRTHLGLAGNSGGYAYAFVNNGYKYVVYAISGSRGHQDGGVIVQRAGTRKVVAKLQCQPGKIIETDKDALIDATLRWKKDSLIETEGLPAMR